MWRPWDTNEIEDEVEEVAAPCDELEEVDDAGERPSQRSMHFLSDDAKNIVLNVYNALISEGESNVVRRTAFLTKVPKSTVFQIAKNQALPRKRRSDYGCHKILTTPNEHAIRGVVYDMYKTNVVPTIKTIHDTIIGDMGINCSMTTLRTSLKNMGFRYKKIDKRQQIMESPRIRKWRCEYLQQIKSFGKNRDRYFTWMKLGMTHMMWFKKDGQIILGNAN